MYTRYKELYEARDVALLQPFVHPDTWVIDVGANIGFFTTRFATWVSGSGKVIALEPEALNMQRLQLQLRKANQLQTVECVQAAVSDVSGDALLIVNPAHPGDHKLDMRTGQGVRVPVTTIDELMQTYTTSSVSLIKVDVQGAEMHVLRGAEHTIETQRPVLYLELDDEGLRQFGSSAPAVLEWCVSRGYELHMIADQTMPPPLTIQAVVDEAQKQGYLDVLLMHT